MLNISACRFHVATWAYFENEWTDYVACMYSLFMLNPENMTINILISKMFEETLKMLSCGLHSHRDQRNYGQMFIAIKSYKHSHEANG